MVECNGDANSEACEQYDFRFCCEKSTSETFGIGYKNSLFNTLISVVIEKCPSPCWEENDSGNCQMKTSVECQASLTCSFTGMAIQEIVFFFENLMRPIPNFISKVKLKLGIYKQSDSSQRICLAMSLNSRTKETANPNSMAISTFLTHL